MTTHSWNTRVRQDSDVYFREWGVEFAAKLALVGLVQTTDTGQINWTTVVRPATSSNAGYEIWRFNDALQGTAPIFIRFDYGAHTSVDRPRIMSTVGTGTNGAGTITGTAITATPAQFTTSFTSTTDTLYPSYMCAINGAFWVAWKVNALSGWLFISRSCDTAGAPTATAAIVVSGGFSGAWSKPLRFAAPATAYAAGTSSASILGFLPQSPQTQTLNANGDMQVAVGWMWTPTVCPIFSIVGTKYTDIADYTAFVTTPVGSTPRTYIALPQVLFVFDGASASLKCAPIWE